MTKAGKSVTPESFVTNASSKKSSVDAQESPVKEPEAKRPIRRRVLEHPTVGAKSFCFLPYGLDKAKVQIPLLGRVGDVRKRIRRCRPRPSRTGMDSASARIAAVSRL
jgi:hypothetical protein